MRHRSLAVLILAVLAVAGCKKKGDGGKASPTPTASPSPTAAVSPTPLACNPKTPPLAELKPDYMGPHPNQQKNPGVAMFDVTPKICDTPEFPNYCETVWHGERWRCCPTRPNGEIEMRVACENELVGQDPDDGKFGPHFECEGGCTVKRDPSNPYLAQVKGTGRLWSCSNIADAKGEHFCGYIDVTPSMLP